MIQRELPAGLDLLALKRVAPRRYPLLLESVAASASARWDLLLLGDGTGLQLDADGVTRSLDGEAVPGRFLDALDSAFAKVGRAPRPDDLPFHGGWGLYLGYELAAQIEPTLRLPEFAALPTALALRCPAAVLRERGTGRCIAVAEAGRDDLLATIDGDLAAIQPVPTTVLPVVAVREDAPQGFLDGVAKVHDYLRAGDVFQVNLSRGWHARWPQAADVHGLYRRLCAANPAPFAGLLELPQGSVLSSSPERLISIRGRRIETRPIAGTRPRFAGDDDAARIRELVGHPKERAEHIMLIDLERNDLGRVCAPGSVRVDELMTVESYAHVHHIVSNVLGQLRHEVTPGQAIAATFPGGTITGCPKVRCMEIIAELEQTGRGPYTGAMGYLDRSGDMDLNILIRTLWCANDELAFRAGAGIVVDSNAEHELQETRAKARGLLRALETPA